MKVRNSFLEEPGEEEEERLSVCPHDLATHLVADVAELLGLPSALSSKMWVLSHPGLESACFLVLCDIWNML